MELVLPLKPEEERQLRCDAEASGQEITDYALGRLLGARVTVRQVLAVRGSTRGKYAHLLSSSEELSRRKKSEIALEDHPL